MTVAILGGSFNPPHQGHISLARVVLAEGYQRILFVPACRPPHKSLDSGANDSDRLEMTRLAATELDGAEVWDGELRRGGISFSIDTVRAVKSLFDLDALPGLVIGDDLAGGFASWKEADHLAREADILLARRETGAPVPFAFPCRRLENPLFPFSSTRIREKLSRGEDVSGLIPPSVAEYVLRHGLYGYRP
jgi:nicotinate-nucleotide adenylyltransferase